MPKNPEVELGVVLDHMPGGMLMLDKDLNVLLVNKSYVEMFEYPEGLVEIGKFMGDMLRYQIERGDLGGVDLDETLERTRTLFRNRENLRYEAHLPSGKIIEIHVAPTAFDGGVAVARDITEQKTAQRLLRASEQLFRAVVEQIPVAMTLKDRAGRYTHVNPVFREWFAEEGVTIEGLTADDLYPKDVADAVASIDRRILETGEQITQEFEEPFVDGLLHTTLMSKFPIRDRSGIVVAIGSVESDITERKQVEQKLSQAQDDATEARRRLADAIEHIAEGFVWYDGDGRLVLCNPKFREFWNYSETEAVPGASYEFLDGLDLKRGIVLEHDEGFWQRRASFGRETDVMHEIKMADGRWLQIRDRKLPSSGNVSIHTDITELKTAEAALEKAHALIKEQNKRMETELNVGREIQMSMIPLTFPAFPDRREFSVYASLEPAREVGGDFYDFFFVGENRFCVCIGDVSGKGVPSALFMAVAKTLIKSRAADDPSTASILTHVNDELSSNNNESMFVTLFIAMIDIKTGEVLFTNAGHIPPFVLRKDEALKRLDHRHGPVVAAIEGMVYEEDRIELSPADTLFLYTDGVTEAMDAKADFFSEERLTGSLAAMDEVTAKKAVLDTVAAVKTFEAGVEQTDDVTVLAFQYHGRPKASDSAALQITLKNNLSEIARLNGAFDVFADEHAIPLPVASKFNLVFDELLNNIVSFAYRDSDEHEISVGITCAANRLTAIFEDDGIPFNPLSAVTPDTRASLLERELGGLGIHLVRNLVDDVSYQRRIDKNVLTLVTQLGARDETGAGS